MCNYHKTNTHSNQECFKQKNISNAKKIISSNENIESKIDILKQRYPLIILEGKIKNKSYNFEIDSGCEFSHINPKFINSKKVLMLKNPFNVQYVNGATNNIDKACTVLFTLDKFSSLAFNHEFVLNKQLKGPTFLGRNFIKKISASVFLLV